MKIQFGLKESDIIIWLDDNGVLQVKTPTSEWVLGEFKLDEDDQLSLVCQPDIKDDYIDTDDDGCLMVYAK